MSMGYGGFARIVLQDENTAIYAYASYNLNEPRYRNADCVYDGLITIKKDALVEAEIHKKKKRMRSGRKRLIVKRILRDVDYDALIEEGAIAVENSKNCWRLLGVGKDIGMIAMQIIFHIFDQFQEDGVLSETISLHY